MSVARLRFETWKKEGVRLFGEDRRDWLFECPVCKNVQGYRLFKERTDLDDDRIRGAVMFNCIGRYTKDEGPGCDYSSGGLLHLAPLLVFHRGRWSASFGFAGAELPPSDEVEMYPELDKLIAATGDAPEVAWPDWVPAEVRKQIADFYQWHNGPKGYFESWKRNDAPDLGYDDEWHYMQNENVRGRFVFAWNNIGRAILPDGGYKVVSI